MKLLSILILAGLSVFIPFARAADDLPGKEVIDTAVAKRRMHIAEEVLADYGYVGGAKTRSGNIAFGNVGEQSSHINYVVTPQLTKKFILRLGADWQRFSFSLPRPNSAPIPNTLQSTAAVIGGDWMLNDQWLLRAETQPGIYSDFQDIDSRDFNAPFILGAAYLVDEHLQWFFGLSFDIFRYFPVVPAAGVRWKFADEWTLMAVLPKPRLEYEFDEKINLYFGGEIKSGSYRVGQNFGNQITRPALNNALVDYTEGRMGLGTEWKVTPSLMLEIEGGYMVYRQFDFHRSSTRIKSDPAPYGQVGLTAKF